MATTLANPETSKAKEEKPKFSLSIRYQNKDGEWKTSTTEREFSVPDKVTDVAVNVVGDDGKQEKFERNFERFIVSNVDEALRVLQENPYLAISAMNYGFDLYARNQVKVPLAAEMEGPGKILRKTAEDIIKNRAKLGKPTISLERAMELAKAQLEAE